MTNATKYTPPPWELGEYDEYLGYDCMTGGIRCGPAVLDGADYGQKHCTPISPEQIARMTADAHLICAAPKLLIALRACLRLTSDSGMDEGMLCESSEEVVQARAVIAEADPE